MQYPIIHIFPNDGRIYAQVKGPERASVSLFNTFAHSIILDSSGTQYVVKGIHKIGWANFFGYHPLMKGRTAKIAYDFSLQEKMSLKQYKDFVINRLSIGVNKDFWYSNKDIPMLVEKVNKCEDFESIVRVFI